MISLTTTSDNTLIRTDVHSHIFPDVGSSHSIARTLTQISRTHKMSMAKLWVVYEILTCVEDDEVEIIAMNAKDFMFLYNLQANSMIVQTPYTPSSIIRMTITDGVIRVWWVDPKKQQDAVAIATWENRWVVNSSHKWLWACIESNLKPWLHDSFQKLKQVSVC